MQIRQPTKANNEEEKKGRNRERDRETDKMRIKWFVLIVISQESNALTCAEDIKEDVFFFCRSSKSLPALIYSLCVWHQA